MAERRTQCKDHLGRTEYLEKLTFKGNGQPSLRDEVVKLKVMVGIVMVLLIGNVSLLGYTMKIITGLK